MVRRSEQISCQQTQTRGSVATNLATNSAGGCWAAESHHCEPAGSKHFERVDANFQRARALRQHSCERYDTNVQLPSQGVASVVGGHFFWRTGLWWAEQAFG